MRAESFMAELNNGVKLCRLIGALQSRISQSGASDMGKVNCGAEWQVEQDIKGK